MLNKFKSPFNNNQGSALSLFRNAVLSLIGLLMVSWLLILIMHIRVESYLQSTVYNLGDAVTESTVVTSSIQTEFKRKIDNYKWYIGDYQIIYFKTSYATGNAVRTKLATSENGATVPNVRYNKGDIVEIVIKSKDAVVLDKINIVPSNAGMAVSYGGKIF